MSARVFVCEGCGAASFPARLLCASCGARAFRVEPVERGTLEDFSDRGNGVLLGAVRAPQGPLLIARLVGEPARGAEVVLDEDGDIPVAHA